MQRPSLAGLRGALLPIAACWALATASAVAQDATPPPPVPIDLLEIEVEGNTVLPVSRIESELMPYLGPARSMADLEAARAALEKAYQTAGYLTVFVDVPEQRVDSGVVRLVVIEGRVESLRVKGARYYSQGYIRSKLEQLAEGKVPNFNELQRELAVLNRTEERQVRPVMRPGQAPGTVEAEIQVVDKLPLSGTVELNNQHAAGTTQTRLTATLRYDNLFQADHSVALTLITAPQKPSESKVLSANYLVPRDDGSTWLASLTASDSRVEPLGVTTVVGQGLTLGARYVKPFGSAADQFHTLSVGVDYKDLEQRVQSGTDELFTPLRYLPWSVAYSGTVNGSGGAQTTITATWLAALRPLLSRKVSCPGTIGSVDQFACTREGASGGFSVFKADVRHLMPGTLGGTLALRMAGQLASGPLVSAEQFYAGGASSVRGYLEAEANGDVGAQASVEWRSGDLKLFSALRETVGFGFVEAARAQTLQPGAGQAARVHLIGSGVGLRAKAGKGLSGELELAWPHRRTANTPQLSPRLHFRLGMQL